MLSGSKVLSCLYWRGHATHVRPREFSKSVQGRPGIFEEGPVDTIVRETEIIASYIIVWPYLIKACF